MKNKLTKENLRKLFSEKKKVKKRVSFKETLDIFLPSNGRAGAPALIYIHGGYWQLSDKNDTTYIAPAFLDAGIAFITINYTLAPEAGINRIVSECRRAVAWVARHADEIGVDRERLFVAGHSAGGHLTAMMLATDWVAFDPSLTGCPFRGACALSGLYDLEPIRLSFLNDVLGLRETDVGPNSPLYLDPMGDVPMILSVGESSYGAADTAVGLAVSTLSELIDACD